MTCCCGSKISRIFRGWAPTSISEYQGTVASNSGHHRAAGINMQWAMDTSRRHWAPPGIPTRHYWAPLDSRHQGAAGTTKHKWATSGKCQAPAGTPEQ